MQTTELLNKHHEDYNYAIIWLFSHRIYTIRANVFSYETAFIYIILFLRLMVRST